MMSGGAGRAAAAADDFVLQIDGGDGEPPCLLLISRPTAGRVRVREWSSENWSGAPAESTWVADDLYARIERAHRARRRLTAELYAVRAWLGGL